MNWEDLVPRDIAKQQFYWERKRTIARMRECGFVYREIGAKFGICLERARDIAIEQSWHSHTLSPVEKYQQSRIYLDDFKGALLRLTKFNAKHGFAVMAFYTPPPVLICCRCGRGFLTAQPARIDQYPEWNIFSGASAPVCGGEIRMYDMRIAIMQADRAETRNIT